MTARLMGPVVLLPVQAVSDRRVSSGIMLSRTTMAMSSFRVFALAAASLAESVGGGAVRLGKYDEEVAGAAG